MSSCVLISLPNLLPGREFVPLNFMWTPRLFSNSKCPSFDTATRPYLPAGFSPICPTLYQPLFLNDAVPEEHKSGIDMGRDLLRRSHVLVVCGSISTESMKNDVAVAQRLGITATTLDGILTVKGQGRRNE